MSKTIQSFLGGIVFYTIFPLPKNWPLEIERIARWAPIIGLMIGGLLYIADFSLLQLNLPLLTRTAVIVGLWIVFSGGLHLDGVMDTADGLAVLDREKRLQVMQDSRSGAFAIMAAIILLLLKYSALIDLDSDRWLGLIFAPGWGRWAQVWAISHYPYLKPEGKGAFHKNNIQLPQDWLIGLIVLISLSAILATLGQWLLGIGVIFIGIITCLGTNFWFYRQLDGFTGDTYGAVVEWTESIFLCLLIILIALLKPYE